MVWCPTRKLKMENSTQSVHKNRAKLGRALLEFEGRILNGIRLDIDKSSGNPSRYVYRFVKVADETAAAKASGEPEKPAETAEPPAKPDEPPEIAAAESCNHVTICNPPESDEPPEIALESCNHVTICNPPAARYSIEKNTSYNEHVCVCDKNVIGYGGSGGLQGVTWLQAPYLALDLETYSGGNKTVNTTKAKSTGGALRPWTGEIRLLTITDAEGGLQRFDLMSAPVLPPEVISAISEKPLIIHNGSFDLLFLAHKLGVHPPGVFCTLTASRLLSGSRLVKHDLAAVLERYLGVKLAKEYGASDWGAARLSFEQLEYAEDDVRYLHRLKEVLMTKLEKAGLGRVFDLESALIPAVVGIEEQGFAVDAQKMRGLLALVEARQGVLQEALRTKFGIPALNPGSSQQVVKAFQSIGETIPNANEETLIALDHEYAPMVLEYHKVAKRVGTITGLLKHVQTDGRIHAQFKPLGTDTGRFSSSKPNLQNIDRGELRTCFVPSAPDRRLIVADYSQIELRIGAIFAKDAAMLDAFRAGEDLHRKTAAGVLSKTVEEVTKADRQLAKAINFGFLYGQQAEGFRGMQKPSTASQ